jgi:hypothetical protein
MSAGSQYAGQLEIEYPKVGEELRLSYCGLRNYLYVIDCEVI